MRKSTIVTFAGALALGSIVAASQVAVADMMEKSTTTTQSTTYSGTVSDVDPSSSTIILKSESSAAPVTYTYSKETTFVDAAGKTVSPDVIMNSPVTIEYSNDAGRTVVRRVVQTGPAHKVERTETHTETVR